MDISRRRTLLLGLSALSGCRRRKGVGFNGYAFVANRAASSVAAVDLQTFSVARQIAVDGEPSQVVCHPNEPYVYVLMPGIGSVHEIAASSLTLLRKVQVASDAVCARIASDGSAIWILCRKPQQLARIALDGFQLDTRIALPREPVDFDLSPDGDNAVVSFGEDGMMCFVSLTDKRVVVTAKLGGSLSTVRFRSDGRHVLAGNEEKRLVSVIEAPSGRLVTHLPLAVRPESFCFKSDGGQLFVSGEGMDAVAVIYTYRTEVAETVLAGRAPGAMAASRDPDYLFVANPESGHVTILDIETRRAIAVVAVGEEPSCIEITPDNGYALVLNRRSGDMAVIRIAAVTANRAKSASLFTMIPVGSEPVSVAVQSV